jgi:pyruvate formate-lyase activating enzyme-like uncharacterized protein
MKKNFLQIVMGALVLTLGLSSCKKDKNCKTCATYSYDGESDTICVGEKGVETQAKFDEYVAYLKSEGYSVTTSEKCD